MFSHHVTVAVPLYPSAVHRKVSLRTVLKGMGATPQIHQRSAASATASASEHIAALPMPTRLSLEEKLPQSNDEAPPSSHRNSRPPSARKISQGGRSSAWSQQRVTPEPEHGTVRESFVSTPPVVSLEDDTRDSAGSSVPGTAWTDAQQSSTAEGNVAALAATAAGVVAENSQTSQKASFGTTDIAASTDSPAELGHAVTQDLLERGVGKAIQKI